jgi:hypothetical protein
MAGAQNRQAPNTPSHYTDLATSNPTSPSYANDRGFSTLLRKTKIVARNLQFDIMRTLSDRKLWETERRKIKSMSNATPGVRIYKLLQTQGTLTSLKPMLHVSFSNLLDRTSVLSIQLALTRSWLRSCQPSKPAPKLRHHATKLCGITKMHSFLLSLGTRRWLVNCGYSISTAIMTETTGQ